MKEKSGFRLSARDELKILRRLAHITGAGLDFYSVNQEVLAVVSELTRADGVAVYLGAPVSHALTLTASTPPPPAGGAGRVSIGPGEGIAGAVFADQVPVCVGRNASQDPRFRPGDAPAAPGKVQALLSVPILFKEKAVGVINVFHSRPRQYTAAVINLIATIGRQVGGILENARLYEEMRLKAVQFDSMVKVSQSITSERYLDEILNLIVVVTAEMFDSKICSIMLLDDSNNELIIKATSSLSPAYKNKPPLRAEGSLVGEAVRSRKALAVLDVRNEPKYQFRDIAVRENLSSMLVVPMIFKNKAIGVTNVYTQAVHAFTPQEIDILQIIANQAAVAIVNTKLMEETLKTREAMQTRKLIDRAKGILMQTSRVTEDAAYKLIQKKSMDSCRSMKEIAEAIILTSDLSKSRGAEHLGHEDAF